MKKQKPEIKLKSTDLKNISLKGKVYPGKSRMGKQGSIRSGGGKRN
jgi:hypothetical protein